MNHDARSIDTIRVSKPSLIATITSNRANHRAKFEEAMEAYKTRAIELLTDHIERIKANAPEKVTVSLPMPEDHTDDYDIAIGMLEHSLDDEVILEQHDYRTLVLDQWGWQQAFSSTYSMYVAADR